MAIIISQIHCKIVKSYTSVAIPYCTPREEGVHFLTTRNTIPDPLQDAKVKYVGDVDPSSYI